MSSRPLKAAVGLAAAGALALAAPPAHAADDPDPAVWSQLSAVFAATGGYQYEPLAVRDGFEATPCAEMPGEGGMGYHYFNKANIGKITPTTPGALLYEDGPDGQRRLIGVEWLADAATTATAPTLFGQTFRDARPYGEPLNGNFYTLHAWIYKDNPDGLFGRWNPDVKCPAGVPTLVTPTMTPTAAPTTPSSAPAH
ncbi:hypothetical protein ACIPSE_04640 [Streptomyces sp. NPDC090106]|uniref:hypothetical protein n=1 Tax=Streptomyces sp. NPDC090106 TaxID=3365946 RepID=UPI0038171B6B